MSHFVVLVALTGSLSVTEISAAVEKALAPFHEFECTGNNDQYVQNVDQLAEAREQFETDTCFTITRPDGSRAYPFNAEGNYNEEFAPFYDKTARDLKLPEGYTSDHDALTKDFRSFADWASSYYGAAIVPFGQEPDLEGDHKYGYTRVNEAGEVIELIDRTNPNKKWDWWTVGGRWSGYFRAKPGTGGVKGERGLMGSEKDAAGVDVIRKGDIDFEAEAAKITAEATARWNKVRYIVGEHLDGFEPWAKVLERHTVDGKITNIDAACDFYHGQPAKKALAEAGRNDRDLAWVELDEFLVTCDEFVQARIAGARTPFAYLDKDGAWHQKGRMGWFATVSDENHDWPGDFAKEFAKLDDQDWLVAVDCHI